MKKYIAASFCLAFVLALGFAQSAGAVAHAIYPDQTDLQPPPAGISANISHNVQNSDALVAPGITPEPANTPSASATSGAQTAPPPAHASGIWWIFGIIAGLGIIAGGIYQYHKNSSIR